MEYTKAMDALIEKLRTGPGQERRMKSKSFWESLGYKVRTAKRIEQVYQDLLRLGVWVDLEQDQFGKEGDEEWLTLKLYDISVPDDAWFDAMEKKTYESETEVEVFFITPLFQHLGYSEEDFAFHYSIRLPSKIEKKVKSDILFPDLLLFDGTDRSPENALVAVEAKKPQKDPKLEEKKMKDAIDEAKLYQISFPARLCVVTNGDCLIVFDPSQQGFPVNHNVTFYRSTLKENWNLLVMKLGKQAVLALKNT